MDASTAEWKQSEEYLHKWAEQIAWVVRLFNNLVGAQDMRSKVGLDALDEDMQGGAQEAYRRLQQAGWVPRWLDSTAVARLPVRAVVPARITYSGRKTSMQEADMEAYRRRVSGETSGSSRYIQDAHGDSIIINRHYKATVLVGTDTVKAH